jgi:hypothetical protein
VLKRLIGQKLGTEPDRAAISPLTRSYRGAPNGNRTRVFAVKG